MNSLRIKLTIANTLFPALLSIALGLMADLFLDKWLLPLESLHSVVEAFGAFTALNVALLLLLLRRYRKHPPMTLWVSCSLIGMGILDGFHASAPPGNSFVWLHSTATLYGGLLLSMVWLPEAVSEAPLAGALPGMAALLAAILGTCSSAFPHLLPPMLSQGHFSSLAKGMNVLGGLFFLASAVRFLLRYRIHGENDDLFFASIPLLFGSAGILFPLSELWAADWWYWHLVRFMAYVVALGYLFLISKRTEEALKQEIIKYKHTEEQLEEEIAEHRQTAEALYASEERYRTIVEHSHDLIWTLDRDGSFTYCNRRTEEIGGYESSDLLGKNFEPLVPTEDLERVRKIFSETLAGNSRQYEISVRRKDQSSFDLSVTNVPLLKSGEIVGIVGFGREITEQKRVMAELRKERDFSFTLLQASPTFFVAIDGNGKTLMMNDTMLQALGYSQGEVIGTDYLPTFVPEGDRQLLSRVFEQITTTHQPSLNENRVVAKDGRELLVEWHGRPVFKASGEFDYFFGVGIDITERRKAEEGIRTEYAFRKAMEDSILAGVAAVDLEGRQNYVNPAFCKMVGWSEEDLTGAMPPFIYWPPEEVETIYAAFQKMLGGSTPPGGFDLRFRRRNDERFDVAVLISPLNDARGKSAGYLASVYDVTERKRAEEQIREQATLLDGAHDAILVRSLEHQILYWNRGAERLYGWTREEALGRDANELLFEEPSRWPAEAQKSVMEKGEWAGELHQITMDQRKIIVESHWTLMRNNEGLPKSILVITTDLTDKKKLEAQFFRSQRMESIGTLAGGIAHDLNNVLTPIMMGSQILLDRVNDEESRKLLQSLQIDARRGADLIKQVLSFARGVRGERLPLQMADVILDVEKILREAIPRSVTIKIDLSPNLWSISGDQTQIHQVLMNLCLNACDAMPGGGILSLSAGNLMVDESLARMNIEARAGHYLVITVSDTGIGIPQEIVDRIFEPFFTTKGPGKGTGLGLSTVLAIVKGHGGFLNVYSEAGKGTTFKVYLPAMETVQIPKEVEPTEVPRGAGELILIVDDEASIREITTATLEQHGYKVLTACDGAEAAAWYAQHRQEIKLVLMDMAMPVMDGPASIQVLRRIDPGVKIIGVSGLTENDRVARLAGAHLHGFLPKPYTVEKLLRAIHKVLSTP